MVLASGSGTNFQSIIDSVQNGSLNAVITRLIASRNDIGAIEKAEKAGIPYEVIAPRYFQDHDDFADKLLKAIQSAEPDLIVLAGYLIKIPSAVIRTYPGKIINIHPALLPAYGGKGYYGLRVHKAVIADKMTESGCTVHFVTEEFDEGPILSQRTVPVYPDDTPEELAKRVLKEEHILLPQTIKSILENN